MNNPTICAIATATGGALGVIRVSGPDAIAATAKIFIPHGKKPLQQRESSTLAFGNIVDKASGETIDEALVSIFRAPHSYTGEDCTELSCHGSAYIMNRVVELLIKAGCVMAQPGEYTQRAFLNGKMDLSQAEAVADIIASSSAATHRMAMSQMRGDFSRRLSALRNQLLKLTSLMELELDFSDHEDLEFADRSELSSLSNEIETVISRLAKSFSLGNALKNGVPVAIVGETNAGKSTLLNALVGEEKAIVSEIHGTTRDVIEDTVNIDGIVFRFFDTAGIRETADRIENLGIERTFAKIEEAQIVLWVIDATCAEEQTRDLKEKILPLCQDKTLIVAYNKADALDPKAPKALSNLKNLSDLKAIKALKVLPKLSAKTGAGIAALKEMLTTAVAPAAQLSDDIVVSNLRHYEALTRALAAIRRVQEGLSSNLPTDLVAQDLRDCLSALADITGGEITTQETLSNIFSHFCVGK